MLGKPKDKADARAMLARLSGQTHEVYTAVCFADRNGELETWVDCTKVTFNTLSEEEIGYYVNKYRPLDKAGAYGIQDGGIVKEIRGSYSNVVGFPCELFAKLLESVK